MQDGACMEMPISEAKSLLRHSGEFHVMEHDPDSDAETIEGLADSLESFSPIVGLAGVHEAERKRGLGPDSLLLDVTGLAHLFGDESQLARLLLQHCQTLGYLPRIAIADTVGVAWAMARYFAGPYFSQHQQAFVLPPGDQETIKQLPVEALRLEPVTTETLFQLGIETIGQLQRLPRNDLAMRFGDAIHRRLDQLSGKIAEPVVARRKPAEFTDQQLLEHPTHHRETIEVIIARLVTRICEQMRARQQGALQWTIQLACQSGSPIEFHVNLFQPTATTAQVMPLVEMQLEQSLSPHTKKYRKKSPPFRSAPTGKTPKPIATLEPIATAEEARGNSPQPAPAPAIPPAMNLVTNDRETENHFHRYTTIQVTEINVSVTASVLLAQQQRQLFDENPRLDRQSLAHLINRLANRIGTPNVVYPSLQSGAQPEYSFRLLPLVDPRRTRRRRKTQTRKQSHTLARPFRLFHPPLNLKQGIRPHCSQSPPALLQLTSHGSSHPPQKLIASWGPERIETGWWRGRTVCRDYWRIETETRQQLWIFRDLRNGEWFLHGEF